MMGHHGMLLGPQSAQSDTTNAVLGGNIGAFPSDMSAGATLVLLVNPATILVCIKVEGIYYAYVLYVEWV